MSGSAPVRSMTGAGRARGAVSIGDAVVEVRAVNGRGLAVKSRLPSDLSGLDREIERVVRARLERGTVTIAVRVERDARSFEASFDEAVFAATAQRLVDLAARHGLAAVTVADVLGVPGVLRSAGADPIEELWRELEPLVAEALDGLVHEREREGAATASAMTALVETVEAGRSSVAARAPALQQEYRERLLARVEEFVTARGVQLEAGDVVREVALFADRVAIAEELQRLGTHLSRLRELLAGGGAIGRKLEFLLQEVLREVNTIGSKSPDVAIAHDVVAMKAAVDKLKEQAANVE